MINRPLNMVADYACNPDNAPAWYVNIQSAHWKTSRPLQVGSQITFAAKFLGRQLVYTYEITEFIPRQRLVMKTSEGPFPMQTTYAWHIVSNSQTRMSLCNTGRPTGFSKLLTPVMSAIMRRANKKDLKKLKQILESR